MNDGYDGYDGGDRDDDSEVRDGDEVSAYEEDGGETPEWSCDEGREGDDESPFEEGPESVSQYHAEKDSTEEEEHEQESTDREGSKGDDESAFEEDQESPEKESPEKENPEKENPEKEEPEKDKTDKENPDQEGGDPEKSEVETRDLTEEERADLREQLGWTDKQLDKCTIDETGVIHYRTDRSDLEGKTAENGVPYERKSVDIHGVQVEGVFPQFESTTEVQLPEDLEKSSDYLQFKECNAQLKEQVKNDPELRAQFDEEQLEDIENGDTPEGCVWHHNEEVGLMQLVRQEDHDRTMGGAAHTGGKALWGGGR